MASRGVLVGGDDLDKRLMKARLKYFGEDPNRERGEFVLIVDAPSTVAPAAQLSAQDEQWLRALLRELPPARAARIVSEVTGASRQTCYARAMEIKDQRGGEPDQTPR